MNLSTRSDAPERMDTDCVDYDDYRTCLHDLSRVNVVTMTHRPMLSWLASQGSGDFSLLDIACGYGDGLRRIRHRFPHARLTGIDLNPWAVQAAKAATDPATGIQFINDDAFAYKPARKFDFIVSSQFTHHLTDEQVVNFLVWQQANAERGWFVSDLHRHALAFYGFPVLARMAMWHRFVREDGQISIARAFRRTQWQGFLRRAGIPDDRAFIAWYIPFRLCVGTR